MHLSESLETKQRTGYLIGGGSILLNILLFGFKYWVGIDSASVAIIADAWHTLSDSFTSMLVIVGFKISSIPADKEHPFGHGRFEIISSVIIGSILAVVGINFFIESIERLSSRQTTLYSLPAVIVFIISVVLKEVMARISIHGGRRIDSRSLMADAWHHRSDAVASLLILSGFFVGQRFWWVDGVMGILVSLFIFHATYGILRESINSLIGEEPDAELKATIEKIAGGIVKENINLHHMHVHNYGGHRELTFHIRLIPDLKLIEAHRIADDLENKLRQELNIEATVHVEPMK